MFLKEIEMRSCGVGHCVKINEVKVISRNEIELKDSFDSPFCQKHSNPYS